MHMHMHMGVLRREKLQAALVGMLPVVQAQDGRARVLHDRIHEGIVLHAPSLHWRPCLHTSEEVCSRLQKHPAPKCLRLVCHAACICWECRTCK